MHTQRSRILWLSVCFAIAGLATASTDKAAPRVPQLPRAATAQKKSAQPQVPDLLRVAVRELVKMQEPNGQWSYKLPMGVDEEFLGYHIANTAIVAHALALAAPGDADAKAAVQRGLAFVLKQLKAPRIEKKGLDPRTSPPIWAYVYALDFLCQVRAWKMAGEHEKAAKEAIPVLVEKIIAQEIPTGGWNYDRSPSSRASMPLTPPVAQSLLLARAQGEKVPDAVFERTRKVLETYRLKGGAFAYEKRVDSKGKERLGISSSVPGSAARAAPCETTLVLLGGGSTDAVQSALEIFFEHWDELEKRRKQKPVLLRGGYHGGPHLIASYFFYYGHRYTAQAIQMLPEEKRAKERERLLAAILKTRDADGTWNDMIAPVDRSYGTAMVVLALLGDRVPLPPSLAQATARDKE